MKEQYNIKCKHFQCDSGRIYELPSEACVFCEYCTDIFWDYTHGIYKLYCEKQHPAVEFGNVPCICKKFRPDLVTEDIIENREA